MIILVTGSRSYGLLDYGTDTERPDIPAEGLLYSLLSGLLGARYTGDPVARPASVLTLVQGQCPTGADALARKWYRKFDGLPWTDHKPFPANWKIYGRGAGPRRNQEMVEYVLAHDDPDKIAVGFVDKPLEESSGTHNCIQRAEKAGLPTFCTRRFTK